MTLLEYIKALGPEELHEFANRVPSTVGYLNQVAYGYKRIGPEFALKLEQASGGILNAEELCPEFPWALAAHGRCPNCDD